MKSKEGRKFWHFLAVSLWLLLAGCHQTSPIQPEQGFDILKQARPIPKLTGQGLAVFHALATTGLRIQEALDADLHVATLETQDPEGNPHAYYNFIAPAVIDDPWEFGL